MDNLIINLEEDYITLLNRQKTEFYKKMMDTLVDIRFDDNHKIINVRDMMNNIYTGFLKDYELMKSSHLINIRIEDLDHKIKKILSLFKLILTQMKSTTTMVGPHDERLDFLSPTVQEFLKAYLRFYSEWWRSNRERDSEDVMDEDGNIVPTPYSERMFFNFHGDIYSPPRPPRPPGPPRPPRPPSCTGSNCIISGGKNKRKTNRKSKKMTKKIIYGNKNGRISNVL
jgi:hypothetical protein